MAVTGTSQQMREGLCYYSNSMLLSVVTVAGNPCSSSPCNTWLRGSPGRSFLGAYSLTWGGKRNRDTEGHRGCGLRALPPGQPSPGGGQPERAPRSSGDPAGTGSAGVLRPPA